MSTERKIQDYLHFYLGCEVEYVGILNGKEIKEELAANKHDVFYIPKIAEIKGPKRGFLREIRCNQEGQFRMCKVGRRGLKSFWGSSPDFKLILRPLSDMTEEEKKEIGFEAFHMLRNDLGDRTLPARNLSCMWAARQTAYLLSRGFDLFNLIPDGLAIDKTTLKP